MDGVGPFRHSEFEPNRFQNHTGEGYVFPGHDASSITPYAQAGVDSATQHRTQPTDTPAHSFPAHNFQETQGRPNSGIGGQAY